MSPQMIEYLVTHNAHPHHRPGQATGQHAYLLRTARPSRRPRAWVRWAPSRRRA